jgi:flavin reductase (DIM6/NTAB) family NADH-FMN oxidoreductase RutF
MPVCIVGAMAQGKPTFTVMAHVGILNSSSPHLLSLGMNKSHFTNAAIKEQKAFSVNMPSQEQVIHADYVGLVSGKKVDKSKVFPVEFGELKNAPVIKTCPLSMECRLYGTLETPTHDVFIGEVVATYASPDVLTEGSVDIAKVHPLLFDMNSKKYWSLGSPVADCWDVGRELEV